MVLSFFKDFNTAPHTGLHKIRISYGIHLGMIWDQMALYKN